MDVIVLVGGKNTGKSKTLNIVYQYMLLFGYVQVPGHFMEIGNRDFYDCRDILEKKGKKVGIATMGDFEDKQPGETVQDLLNYFDTNGCNIAICACNDMLQVALAFIRTYNHQIIQKTVRRNRDGSDERIVNGEDAERVYRLI